MPPLPRVTAGQALRIEEKAWIIRYRMRLMKQRAKSSLYVLFHKNESEGKSYGVARHVSISYRSRTNPSLPTKQRQHRNTSSHPLEMRMVANEAMYSHWLFMM